MEKVSFILTMRNVNVLVSVSTSGIDGLPVIVPSGFKTPIFPMLPKILSSHGNAGKPSNAPALELISMRF